MSQQDARPNILFIISDDTDFRYIGAYGGSALTPNIDRLAREGMTFYQAYCASSVCTPSRYNYLTGHYAGRCTDALFLSDNQPDQPYRVTWNTRINLTIPTVGSMLRAGGYRTGYVGKWHTGGNQHLLPIPELDADDDLDEPGVDSRLADYQAVLADEVRSSGGFDVADAIFWGNNDADMPINRLQTHHPEWMTARALDFIEAESDQPFFLTFATTLLHGPSPLESLQDDPRYTHGGKLDAIPEVTPPRETVVQRLREAEINVDHHNAGMTWLDDQVGALLDKLEALGILDNTVVFYCTDHNTEAGKATCYQKGINIPTIVRWPGEIEAGSRCDVRIQNIDFVPTALEIAGVTPLPDVMLDGKSYLPQLRGSTEPLHDDLFFEMGYTRAVLYRNWKYVALRYPRPLIAAMRDKKLSEAPNHMGQRSQEQAVIAMHNYPGYFDADQLYDLDSDPREQHNLADDPEHEEILRVMKARLLRYLVTFGHPFDLEDTSYLKDSRFRDLAAATRENVTPDMVPWYEPEVHNRV